MKVNAVEFRAHTQHPTPPPFLLGELGVAGGRRRKKRKHPAQGSSLPLGTRNLDARIPETCADTIIGTGILSPVLYIVIGLESSMADASFEFLVESLIPLLYR